MPGITPDSAIAINAANGGGSPRNDSKCLPTGTSGSKITGVIGQ